MNRANMSKQITEVPMKKGYKMGGTVSQTMCSPRKQMAMGNG